MYNQQIEGGTLSTQMASTLRGQLLQRNLLKAGLVRLINILCKHFVDLQRCNRNSFDISKRRERERERESSPVRSLSL